METCNKFNYFCYVCGKYTIMPSRRKITIDIINLYETYFSLSVICGMVWTPSVVCTTCIYHFNKWKKNGVAMPYAVPMIWRNPILHIKDECYACINHTVGMNRRKCGSISYIATTYTELPVPHSSIMSVPDRQLPIEDGFSNFESLESFEPAVSAYQQSNITIPCNHNEITQNRLDIMVRRLKLSQRQSIILAKELKQANILAPDVKIFGAINRHRRFTTFFKSIENNSLAYCIDIRGLIITIQDEYDPGDWRLFIDSSKSSLKAVLLHVTNLRCPIPIALSTNTKETYESMKKIIQLIKYEDHKWKICADLKVVALLRGMQLGYTKNMCFMCLWDTRFDGDQYTTRDWPLREEIKLHRNNIIQLPLVPMEKILLPPLHIKLGIVKNFIKALNPDGIAFMELRRIFPRLSAMKVKEGVLNGPDIRRLMKDQQFENSLNDIERLSWNCIKLVIQNVLGNHRSENWRTLIINMLTAFQKLKVRMSLKIHFLHCHAEKFNEQSPSESDEHGERFHQVTARLENWYSGKKLDSLLGDICWNLQAEEE